jgi:hypothetical protein
VPEEDFSIVEEDGCEQEGATDDTVAEGHIFDDCIRPHSNPSEVNQERDEVDFESPADRQKHVEEADEDEGGAHDHPGNAQLPLASGVLV